MKNILITAALMITSTLAFSSDMIFNEILLQKNTESQEGVVFVTNQKLSSWCANRGFTLSAQSFEVIQTLDSLSNGLYLCTGKFARIPGPHTNPIQMFAIDNCASVNPIELKATCPAKP